MRKRRNLAGLEPPLAKDMAAAVAATVLTASAGGSGTSSAGVPVSSLMGSSMLGAGVESSGGGAGLRTGGKTATEDGNYSSTDDEAVTIAAGLSSGRGETVETRKQFNIYICIYICSRRIVVRDGDKVLQQEEGGGRADGWMEGRGNHFAFVIERAHDLITVLRRNG